MEAIVKNFRGIVEAQINVSPLALLCGLNGAGKTSIARAIAAAASGKAVPYAKLTKKECGIMLRTGTRSGMVAVGTQEGSTQVEWPSGDVASTGRPPFASEIATGLTDLFSMTEKNALAYLINMLKASPTQKDLADALAEVGINETAAALIWKTIEAQGWEAAHDRAKETGTKLKGVWESITATAFGSKKAVEWTPEGWEDSLANETAEDLEEAMKAAGKRVEDAISKKAVSQAERDQLQKAADQIPIHEQDLAAEEQSLKDAEAELAELDKQLRETPNPNAQVDYSCPHCEGLVHITPVSGTAYALTKAAKVEETKLKELRLAHAGLCGKQQNAAGKVVTARNGFNATQQQLRLAQEAKAKLDQLGDAAADDTQSEVTAAKEYLALQTKNLQLFEQYNKAKKTALQVAENQSIIELLNEKGLRKKKLSECLDAFLSAYVTPLCGDLGIQAVGMDTDLNVAMGDISYQMLSASEQFRVRTVLQMAIAKLEGASLVVIDGADILDRTSRARLLDMAVNARIPAIICMTLNAPDLAPDLFSQQLGKTYWIDNGHCQHITKSQFTAKEAA